MVIAMVITAGTSMPMEELESVREELAAEIRSRALDELSIGQA